MKPPSILTYTATLRALLATPSLRADDPADAAKGKKTEVEYLEDGKPKPEEK